MIFAPGANRAISSLAASASLSKKTTRLPWPRKFSTIADPIPVAPPVTNTTAPSSPANLVKDSILFDLVVLNHGRGGHAEFFPHNLVFPAYLYRAFCDRAIFRLVDMQGQT